MLALILSSPERMFQPELRANVCALLGTVGKTATSVRDATRTAVRALAEINHNNNTNTNTSSAATDHEKMVSAAATRALEMWA